MRGRAARSLLPAAVVLALVGVVAIASAGTTPVGTADSRPPSEIVLDTFFSFALVLLVVAAALFVYGLLQRRAIAEQIASGRYPRSTLLTWIIFASLFTTAIWLGYRGWAPRLGGDSPIADVGATLGPVDEPGDALSETAEYRAEFAWIPVSVVVLLMGGAVAAYVLAERRRRSSRPNEGSLAEELADVLDDTLDDLRAEPDARRAVVAAFARLERTLAAAGAPRARAETADEYVARVLGALAIDAAAVSRLGALFVRAKFSPHAVDTSMKRDAIAALGRVRDELRTDRRELEPAVVS